MSTQKIKDLGLAEFVAGLISETFEAVSASLEEQVRREAEMKSAAVLPPSEFLERYIKPDERDVVAKDVCKELFGELLEEGSPYQPEKGSQQETPALREVLGLELQERTGVRKKPGGGGWVLTEAGAMEIREAILERFAASQQDTLLQVLNKGMPRIVVDSGRILSKVSFSLLEEQEAGSPAASTAATAPSAPSLLSKRTAVLNRLGKARTNLVMPSVQFRVRQADEEAPQSSKTDLYGEVEIHFRTVS
ncbi:MULTISPECIES: hypothetical protein [Prosthecochloris]|uniref:Uncharacterized protein n=1 Tax=Prosthecochloris vibrioformis TaxID=1098 RepID=A0A5C4RTC0_PROVB|nr:MULTISPECIES: hypothetical protein [Prosthecochloris]ANT64650.1 hypothetical protein Ptc2401_00863 [Prosthecochloris sp. CIB 2401]TNJ34195.1 hypothetical protein FGF68_10185 [Prosthecochloris vibrioformis]